MQSSYQFQPGSTELQNREPRPDSSPCTARASSAPLLLSSHSLARSSPRLHCAMNERARHQVYVKCSAPAALDHISRHDIIQAFGGEHLVSPTAARRGPSALSLPDE